MHELALAPLAGLFASAFLSATVLPGSSEIALAALVADAPGLAPAAVLVATVGNTLGGLTSYAMGRALPAPPEDNRALAIVRRFGVWALLLSWVPMLGDALCIASGWLRQRVLLAACAIAVGKFVRYLVVAEGVRRLSI
jgi:membrane protein YqaA with SNARE-associated domain